MMFASQTTGYQLEALTISPQVMIKLDMEESLSSAEVTMKPKNYFYSSEFDVTLKNG